MVSECDRMMKAAIPAVRIAVATLLSKKYLMSQKNIADRLGITQASVNKYLNGRYSKKIMELVTLAKKSGSDAAIAGMVVSGKSLDYVNEKIDGAASSMYQSLAS